MSRFFLNSLGHWKPLYVSAQVNFQSSRQLRWHREYQVLHLWWRSLASRKIPSSELGSLPWSGSLLVRAMLLPHPRGIRGKVGIKRGNHIKGFFSHLGKHVDLLARGLEAQG